MGECFFKLAAYYVLDFNHDITSTLLQPLQLALSSGGSERAFLRAQSALELSPAPSIALTLDFSNAFNTLSRSIILSNLFSRSSLCLLAHLLLGLLFSFSSPRP